MNLLTGGAFSLFLLLTPALLIAVAHRYRWAKKLGAIGLCYLAGLLLGNIGWELVGLDSASLEPIQQSFADISIAVALPMLLMTLNLRQWQSQAGSALLSMLLATTSVVAVVTCLYLLWQSSPVEGLDTSHMAAMAVGVYTGGTPNLAAIKSGLDIPDATYVVFHSVDTVIGACYLVLMLSIAIPLVRRLFPRAARPYSQSQSNGDIEQGIQRYGDDYRPLLNPANWWQLAKVSVLSLICVGLALGATQLAQAWFGWNNPTALTIVLLTLAGVGLSFLQPVQALDLAYRFGMYFIYVFCFAIASMTQFDRIADVDPSIALFIGGTLIGSLCLHALFCRLSKIDGDTFMVTSVAAICSPPFVPLMAKALNNSSLILSGMTTGIIGYALGNFLGISLALTLQSFY